MSFTRRVKYGNIMAARKLKKKMSSERMEAFGLVLVFLTALFVMNIAIVSM